MGAPTLILIKGVDSHPEECRALSLDMGVGVLRKISFLFLIWTEILAIYNMGAAKCLLQSTGRVI